MSSSPNSSASPVPAGFPAAPLGSAASQSLADGRIRLLCPGGIDATRKLPDGGTPLMAYIVYAPLTGPDARRPLPPPTPGAPR